MPRPRFQNLDPEKRKAILDAAAEEFAADGLQAASYNKIIERAGVSKGAMYYYFDDKDDLFAAVVMDRVQRLLEVFHVVPDVGSAGEFWEALSDLSNRFVEFAREDPVTMALLRQLSQLRVSGVDSPVVQQVVGLAHMKTEQFLRKGQEVGAIRTDLPFELLMRISTALDDTSDKWFAEHFPKLEPEEVGQWSDVAVDLFRRLLEPGKKPIGEWLRIRND